MAFIHETTIGRTVEIIKIIMVSFFNILQILFQLLGDFMRISSDSGRTDGISSF
jgi:hypothetical protein